MLVARNSVKTFSYFIIPVMKATDGKLLPMLTSCLTESGLPARNAETYKQDQGSFKDLLVGLDAVYHIFYMHIMNCKQTNWTLDRKTYTSLIDPQGMSLLLKNFFFVVNSVNLHCVLVPWSDSFAWWLFDSLSLSSADNFSSET